METTMYLAEPSHRLTVAAPQSLRVAEDIVMIKRAAELTRDLNAPNARLYWLDMIASATIGYAGVATATLSSSFVVAVIGGIVAILALYRAGSFIHEITHIKQSAVPGFRLGWNLLVGIPLLVPSFMYEGIHNLHHQRVRYGTSEDPEYLPLALMKPYTVPLFVVVAAFAPIALLFRYAVLSPLSLGIPALRTVVVERFSGLQINPSFRRRAPDGEAKRVWHWLEAGASAWSVALVLSVLAGILPLLSFVIMLAIVAAVTVLNQVRTLVAHLWENDGEVLTVTGQYLDSVNVPPPGFLPELWAPVGLRYHALHHLLPGLPYHALGEAHRRISAELGSDTNYRRANYAGLFGLVFRLVRSAST